MNEVTTPDALSAAESPASPPTPASPGQLAWRRFRRNRLALICGLFLACETLLAVVWPWITPYGPDTMSNHQFLPPCAAHWWGTDVHGRDLLSRVGYGTRISLLIGTVGAIFSLVIGVSWGAVAGYVGGRWDALMMRFVDVLYSLPSIIFVIVLITTVESLFEKSLNRFLGQDAGGTARILFLLLGLGAVSWLTMARIVRGQVLSLRSHPFVEASRTLGAGPIRILRRHILPHITGVIIVYLTLTVPSIILYESFLSYLGLGIQPPQASLGSLIAQGAAQINPIKIYWWIVVFPAAVLVATLMALNFFGDGLRDALDPRSNG